jgi:hypothetical protein
MIELALLEPAQPARAQDTLKLPIGVFVASVAADIETTIRVTGTGYAPMSATAGGVAPGSHEVWSYWLQPNTPQ